MKHGVLTNLKAIAECAWGPLSYNCLTNPEIQPKATWQGNDQNNIVVSAHLPAQVAPPEQLNLMNGVARTLINKIVDLTNQDWAQTGVNAEEQAAYQWETAQQQLNQSKTYSDGLHVAMGKFALRMDVVEHLRRNKQTGKRQPA